MKASLLVAAAALLVLSPVAAGRTTANPTPIQVYGAWHCGNDACLWGSVRDMTDFDAKNHWQVMWRLAIPLAWPVTTIAILLRTIECLKVFAIPFALTTGGPGTSTEVFSSTDYLTTIQFFDFGKGSAMGIIFLIMVSAIITLFFRQMRRSLA